MKNVRRVSRLLAFHLPGVLLGGIALLFAAIPGFSAQEQDDLAKGRAIYRGHCAVCHGIDGGGNGPKATGLTPPPTNFRNATAMSALPDNSIEVAILIGKPNTAMAGYGKVLSSKDVTALVKYLRSLSAAQ